MKYEVVYQKWNPPQEKGPENSLTHKATVEAINAGDANEKIHEIEGKKTKLKIESIKEV